MKGSFPSTSFELGMLLLFFEAPKHLWPSEDVRMIQRPNLRSKTAVPLDHGSLSFLNRKKCVTKRKDISQDTTPKLTIWHRIENPALLTQIVSLMSSKLIKIPLNFFVTVLSLLSLNLQTSQKTFSTLKRNSRPTKLLSSLEKDHESTHLPTPHASRSWICCCSSSSLEGTS